MFPTFNFTFLKHQLTFGKLHFYPNVSTRFRDHQGHLFQIVYNIQLDIILMILVIQILHSYL